MPVNAYVGTGEDVAECWGVGCLNRSSRVCLQTQLWCKSRDVAQPPNHHPCTGSERSEAPGSPKHREQIYGVWMCRPWLKAKHLLPSPPWVRIQSGATSRAPPKPQPEESRPGTDPRMRLGMTHLPFVAHFRFKVASVPQLGAYGRPFQMEEHPAP